MKSIKNIIILSLFFLISSCEKELEIEMPQHQPKAVINSIFKHNNPFFIYAHKSVGILEPQSEPVQDASIKLYKEGIYLETLQFIDTCYQSEHVVDTEVTYKIIADLPGLETVTATNYAPAPPTLVSAEFLGIVSSDIWFDEYQISFTIEDDVNKENYYLAEVEAECNYSTIDGNVYDNHCFASLYNDYDPILSTESSFFSDALFNGNTQTIKGNFSFSKDITLTKLKLKIYASTKEYSDFSDVIGDHLDTQYGDDLFGYVEPVPMYTNIDGGYGIFAGYSEVELVLFDHTKK